VDDADRHRLLGTYQTPLFAYGQTVRCRVRGAVVIVGLSGGPIPWPVGQPVRGRAVTGLVVFADLVKALRRESAPAVARWWGVSENAGWRWRKALGLAGQVTEGSKQLLRQAARSPARLEALARLHARSRDPEQDRARREAISRAKLGKRQRPRKVGPRGGHGKGWTPAEDALLATLSNAEVARRTGRTSGAVRARRAELGGNRRDDRRG
jgi:hypothetical protein